MIHWWIVISCLFHVALKHFSVCVDLLMQMSYNIEHAIIHIDIDNKVYFMYNGCDVKPFLLQFSQKLMILEVRFYGQFLCNRNVNSCFAQLILSSQILQCINSKKKKKKKKLNDGCILQNISMSLCEMLIYFKLFHI